MPKLGMWVDDELDGRINELHAAMKRRNEFRDLKLTKTDVIKMLIRRSLDTALMEYGVVPKDLDLDEVLEAIDDHCDRERGAARRAYKQR